MNRHMARFRLSETGGPLASQVDTIDQLWLVVMDGYGWLVVGFNPSEKIWSVSWDDDSNPIYIYIWEKKKWQPNHQPVMVDLYTSWNSSWAISEWEVETNISLATPRIHQRAGLICQQVPAAATRAWKRVELLGLSPKIVFPPLFPMKLYESSSNVRAYIGI